MLTKHTFDTLWQPTEYNNLQFWLRADKGIPATVSPTPCLGSGFINTSSIAVMEPISIGDTILVVISSTTGPFTPNDTVGNTYVLQNSTTLSGTTVYLYTCLSATKPSPRNTNFISSGGSNIGYAHYSNVSSIEVGGSAATGVSSNIPDPGNITPTSAGETIVSVAFAIGSGTVPTAGTNYTLRSASTVGAWQDYENAPGGSQSAAFGNSVSWNWGALAIAMVPKSANAPDYLVPLWQDLSTNKNNATTVAALSSPRLINADPSYNNQSTVVFYGNSGAGNPAILNPAYLQLTNVFPSLPFTIFIAGETSTGVGPQEFFGDSNNNTCIYISIGAGTPFIVYAGTFLQSSNQNYGPQAYAGIFNGASSSLYINSSSSAAVAGNAGTNNPSGTAYIGRGAPGNYLNGKIAEIIVYGQVMNSAQISKVFQYFAQRYGKSWA